jgi:hypothetical protein
MALSTTRKIAFALTVSIVVALVLGAGTEIYLRRTRSHIIALKRTPLRHRLGISEQDAALIVSHTDRGRRIVPGAEVLIKNHYLSHIDIPFVVNSLGFRGEEIPLHKTAGVPRVLMLGDSITQADYLLDEDTWVRQTQRGLEHLLGHRVEALNSGVGDTGSQEQMDILEETGLRVKPDVVVLGFYLNDSRPTWGFPGEVSGRNWLRRNSLLVDKLYEKLIFRRWIERQGAERFSWVQAQNRLDWKHNRADFLKLARLAQYDWGAAWNDDSWKEIDAELTRLESDARRNGFRVATLTFPVSFQVYAIDPDDAPQRAFAALAKKHGFSNLDLLPLYRAHASEKILFDQCHPTAMMNRLIGEAITPFVLEEVKWVAAGYSQIE